MLSGTHLGKLKLLDSENVHTTLMGKIVLDSKMKATAQKKKTNVKKMNTKITPIIDLGKYQYDLVK